MPRYFFHLYDDVDAHDEGGKELEDLDAAIELARYQARFTVGETIKEQGRVNLDHRIDIEDEVGSLLATVRFGDVVSIDGRA